MKQLGILLLSLCVLAVPAKSQPGLITNSQLAGGIDLTTKVAGVLPPANGGFLCTLSPCINQQPMVTPGSLGIGTTYGVMQAGTTSVNWDFNSTGLAIGRNITTNQPMGEAQNALWVQEDFSGATGTPWAFATRLKVSNDNCSNGCAASANYVEGNSGMTGVAFAVHGQCDINYFVVTGTTCVGINAEGSITTVGSPGGLIGVESNMNNISASGTTPTVFGMQIQMNNGNLMTPLSSALVMQSNDHTVPFGLNIQDAGGQFVIPAIITSTQSSPGDLVFLNALAGTGAASSSIWFQRSTTNNLTGINRVAAITATNDTGDFSAGSLHLMTAKSGGSAPLEALILDSLQVGHFQAAMSLKPMALATFTSIAPCASGTEGTVASITNSNTATWGSTITGTGANHVLAYCDGTNLTVIGQ